MRLWGKHGYFARLSKLVIENDKKLDKELEAGGTDIKSSKKIKKTKSQKNAKINKTEADSVKVGGGDAGGLEGSWLSFWCTEWLKGGWLEGWLVVAGRLAGGWGGHGDRLSREKPVRWGLAIRSGGQNQHNYQEGVPYQQWTRD